MKAGGVRNVLTLRRKDAKILLQKRWEPKKEKELRERIGNQAKITQLCIERVDDGFAEESLCVSASWREQVSWGV